MITIVNRAFYRIAMDVSTMWINQKGAIETHKEYFV